MSHIILHSKVKTARKQYDCCMQEWITAEGEREVANNFPLTFAEKRGLIKMRNEKYKIMPGDKYYEQVGIQDGRFYCIQCRIDVTDLCRKYDLWCE
jgi:hypothetical protein